MKSTHRFTTLRKKIVIFLWLLSPAMLGGIIYLIWRPVTIRFFSWLSLVGFDLHLESIRSVSMLYYDYIPDWIVFSLPNGLWALSYALIMTYIWWGSKFVLRYFWLGSIPVLALGYEILQYAGVIQGVFCYQDLFLCSIGIFLGITIGVNIKSIPVMNENGL